MASKRAHLDQAEHNITAASQLKKQDFDFYTDWITTMCFYACVHYAEAAFDQIPGLGGTELVCPPRIAKHEYRVQLLNHHFPAVAADYVALRRLSETARYTAGVWISRQSANEALRAASTIKVGLGLATP